MKITSPIIIKIESDNVSEFGRAIHAAAAGCFYCTRGYVDLRMNDKVYHVERNQLFIYIPFCHVLIEEMSADIEGVLLAAPVEFVTSAVRNVSNSANLFFISENPLVDPSENYRIRLEKLMELFYMRLKEPDAFCRLALESLAHVFCFEVLGAYFEKNPIRPTIQSRQDEILFRFRRELYDKCREHRDVSYYAESQNLTPRYFSNIIHRASGRTALNWIVSAVIDEAKELISDPCISFKEVAFALNFSSQSSFARYFRQYTGMSPGEYRASSRRL